MHEKAAKKLKVKRIQGKLVGHQIDLEGLRLLVKEELNDMSFASHRAQEELEYAVGNLKNAFDYLTSALDEIQNTDVDEE